MYRGNLARQPDHCAQGRQGSERKDCLQLGIAEDVEYSLRHEYLWPDEPGAERLWPPVRDHGDNRMRLE